ncbi:hypothetical protein ACP70R_002694 [Stipagrostis hirtigluma subsp. patula]
MLLASQHDLLLVIRGDATSHAHAFDYRLLQSPDSPGGDPIAGATPTVNVHVDLVNDHDKRCPHQYGVFVANPNKPRDIIQVLVDNHRELLKLLHNLPTSKGEDEQLDEERDLIIKEIEKVVQSEQPRC